MAAAASDPFSVDALAVRDPDRLVLLLASLRPEPVRVLVEGLGAGCVEARPLDALAGGWAEPEAREVRRGVCEFELAPWPVTRVTASSSEWATA